LTCILSYFGTCDCWHNGDEPAKDAFVCVDSNSYAYVAIHKQTRSHMKLFFL